MRLLLLALLCGSAAPLVAQNPSAGGLPGSEPPSLLQRPVTLQIERLRLDSALGVVARAAGVRFAYSRAVLPVTRVVSLHGDAMPLGEALDSLLAGTGVDVVVSSSGQLALVRRRQASGEKDAAAIAGVVRDSSTGRPIPGASLLIVGTAIDARAGADGRYRLTDVPAGIQTIRARAPGYRPADVLVAADSTTPVDFSLAPLPVTLSEVVVTPGRFTLLEESTGKATLSREDLETMPQIGDDVYRAVNRLPGMTSHEMSAKFWVRGGSNDEVLVRLDGLELYEPFHLKDFDGSLSIIDVQSVNGVELLTGGFAADYGNRLTGVFNLQTAREPIEGVHGYAGISIGGARVAARGGFAGGRGQWRLSARRGYIDVVLRLFDVLEPDDEVSPRFYDALGLLQYRVSDRHTVAFQLLGADDRTTYRNSDSPLLRSGYVSHYAWGTWTAQFNRRLSAQTILSAGRLSWRRDGLGEQDTDSIYIHDHRWFRFGGLKQDWTVQLPGRQLFRAGGEVKPMESEYDYLKWRQTNRLISGAIVRVTDSALADLRPDGTGLGGYLAYRAQPVKSVTLELSGRADRYSHPGETTLSPRASVAWNVRRGTTLRAAWGRYFQPQQLFQLGVQDNDRQFHRAELAEHRVIGVEQAFSNGVNVTVEAYRRVMSRSRPVPMNLEADVDAFAELLGDRLLVAPAGGEARGIETFIRRRGGLRWDWSLSYALAEAWDRIEGRKVPRRLDQRHTFQVELGYRPNSAWSVSAAWQFHTGWPITPSTWRFEPLADGRQAVVREFGPVNSSRLPAYHRMDVRVSRRWRVGRGRLLAFLDVFNVYNRDNPRGLFYNVNIAGGNLVAARMVDNLLPILPTFGVSYEF